MPGLHLAQRKATVPVTAHRIESVGSQKKRPVMLCIFKLKNSKPPGRVNLVFTEEIWLPGALERDSAAPGVEAQHDPGLARRLAILLQRKQQAKGCRQTTEPGGLEPDEDQ